MGTRVSYLQIDSFLFTKNNCMWCHCNGFQINFFMYRAVLLVKANLMSRHHSTSPDKSKLEQSLIWVHGSVFWKLVYFGQEGVLKTLTTARNCFISSRFILIGTSKVAYFAHCQSLACVAVQCAHNSTAERRWMEGGVNDLTEDSVELTPATEQTICSFH